MPPQNWPNRLWIIAVKTTVSNSTDLCFIIIYKLINFKT